MTYPTRIIELIKSSGIYEGNDVDISVDELITLDHNIPPDEIIMEITEIDDVKMSDKGIIIPKNHFEQTIQ